MGEWPRDPRNGMGRWLYRVRWLLGGLAALVVVLGSVLVFPRWLIDWELGNRVQALNPPDLARAINDVRTTLLQGVGGMAVLLGAFFAYRQLQVNQGGQITERFTRAVDHLGHTEADVRLGGIHALGRIAKDSPDDRVTIAEILTAFIRHHAPWPPMKLAAEVRDPAELLPRLTRRWIVDSRWPIEVEDLPVRALDVQAAMTVLGRQFLLDEAHPLNLSRVDLSNVWLEKANLPRAQMSGANLLGAELSGANLRGADLRGVNLGNANLPQANLQGAELHYARLDKTELDSADLRNVDLSDATLREAWLCNADLRRARLFGAQLQGALVEGAKWEGARADAKTEWPEGFDWKAARILMMDDESSSATAP